MKTSPTIVPVLLLLIAFGCFLAAPTVLAEGPWDGENSSGGSHTLHGSQATQHSNGDDSGDAAAMFSSTDDSHQGDQGTLVLFYRIAVRLFVDYYVMPSSMDQVTSAKAGQQHASTALGAAWSQRAAK